MKHLTWMFALAFGSASLGYSAAPAPAPAAAPAKAVPARPDADDEVDAPARAAQAAPAATPADGGRRLKKKIGVGLEYIPGASQALPFLGVASTPNALGLRWWVTERVGLDLRLAMDANSVRQGTTGTANSTMGWGVGLGAKMNLSRPSRDLLAQLVARVSVGGSSQGDSGSGSNNQGRASVTETALFLGVGFEAFVPGWDWISLEGSAGLGVNAQQVVPDSNSSQVSQSSSRLYLGGEGFSPLNLALHFYF